MTYLMQVSMAIKAEASSTLGDIARVVYTSDGALLRSYTSGPLKAAHFEESGAPCNLIAHRAPAETGGSRIRT